MTTSSRSAIVSTVFVTFVVAVTGCAMETGADSLTGATSSSGKKKSSSSSSSSTSSSSSSSSSGSSGITPSNVTVAPVISVLQPGSVPAGARNTTITIVGSGLANGSTVEVSGTTVSATGNGSSSLVVNIPDDKLTNSGAVGVTVVSGTFRSNTAFFAVSSPQAATVSSLSPTSTQAGAASVALRVDGSGFKSTSQVVVGGQALATSLRSDTSLSATIPASLLNTATTHAVAVRDSATGATSTTLNFQVTGRPEPQTCEEIAGRNTCLNSGCGWYEPAGPCATVNNGGGGGGASCDAIGSRSNCLNSGCGWIEPFGPCIE